MENLLRYKLILMLVMQGFVLHGQCIDSSLINKEKLKGECFEYEDVKKLSFEKIDEFIYYHPVCGCNNITYTNEFCAMYIDGIKTWSEGPCECKSTLTLDTSYIVDEFYQLNRPNATKVLNPVCGCDGKPYLSYIHALKSGVLTWEKGNCGSCIDSSIINKNIKCEATSLMFQNRIRVFGCDGIWYDSAYEAYYHHGVTKFFNYFDTYNCKIDSSRIDTTIVCDSNYDPVCGCDWKTYPNSCVAEHHYGVVDYYPGPCDCRDIAQIGQHPFCDTDVFSPVCGCDGTTYFNYCIAQNKYGVNVITKDAPCKDCIDSSAIVKDIECIKGGNTLLCGCDDKIYENYCEAFFKNGVVKLRECNCYESIAIIDTIDCFESSFFQPVCGCDGRTYPNKCYANNKAGLTSYKEGICDNACREEALIIDDILCSDLFEPVCGCDSLTYRNSCEARYKFGIVKFTFGACLTDAKDESYPSSDILLFPNPAHDILQIGNIQVIDEIFIKAYNSIGELAMNLNFRQNENTIDISSLTPGMYLFHIKSNNSFRLQAFKILIN